MQRCSVVVSTNYTERYTNRVQFSKVFLLLSFLPLKGSTFEVPILPEQIGLRISSLLSHVFEFLFSMTRNLEASQYPAPTRKNPYFIPLEKHLLRLQKSFPVKVPPPPVASLFCSGRKSIRVGSCPALKIHPLRSRQSCAATDGFFKAIYRYRGALFTHPLDAIPSARSLQWAALCVVSPRGCRPTGALRLKMTNRHPFNDYQSIKQRQASTNKLSMAEGRRR